jgi:hypothetical protein
MDEEEEGFSGLFYVALLIGIIGLLGFVFSAGLAVGG